MLLHSDSLANRLSEGTLITILSICKGVSPVAAAGISHFFYFMGCHRAVARPVAYTV